jgi:DNA polymerase-3 subunit gamma/tau
MTQALYRKWRPARFDEVIGQEHVTRTLRNAVAAGRIGHAYLFAGPRGTGKTTTARLLAKAANCLHDDLTERPCNACGPCQAVAENRFLDLIEIDAASNTGVDDIRDLRDKVNFSPSEGRYKVYIIDEVHMLSPAAFNALLKTLEEPPAHAIFILATTEEHKVPLTIRSRCQPFSFRLLTTEEIGRRLAWLADQEALQIEPEALAMIAQSGAGSLRDAESLLDQLFAAPGDAITLGRAQMVLGVAPSAAVRSLTDAWLAGDGSAGLQVIHVALAHGADARQFGRQMVAYLRQLLLLQTAGGGLTFDIPVDEQSVMAAQADRASRAALIDALKHFNEAASTPIGGWQPQLPLELAFIELLPLAGPVAAPRPRSEPAAAETAAPPQKPAPAAEQSEAPVAEPAVASTDGENVLTLAQITGRWSQLRERLAKHDRNLPALLAAARPLGAEGNSLVLGFDYPVLKEKFDQRPGARDAVADTLSELMGLPCQVKTVLSAEYRPVVAQARVDRDEFAALAEELGGVIRDD